MERIVKAIDGLTAAVRQATQVNALELEYRYRLGTASASGRQRALAGAAASRLRDMMDALELDGVTDTFDSGVARW